MVNFEFNCLSCGEYIAFASNINPELVSLHQNAGIVNCPSCGNVMKFDPNGSVVCTRPLGVTEAGRRVVDSEYGEAMNEMEYKIGMVESKLKRSVSYSTLLTTVYAIMAYYYPSDYKGFLLSVLVCSLYSLFGYKVLIICTNYFIVRRYRDVKYIEPTKALTIPQREGKGNA